MKMDLSPTQKANIRKRLKAADDVVMKIQQSGVECNALVSRVFRENIRTCWAVLLFRNRAIRQRLGEAPSNVRKANTGHMIYYPPPPLLDQVEGRAH